MLWLSDEAAAHSEGGKSSRTSGWSICAMTAVAILNKMQAGKTALIKKDGEEMLLAIVLDKPLAAQTLVNDPDAFISKLRGSFKQACAPALGRSGRFGYRVL